MLPVGSAGAWGELYRRADRAWPELLRSRNAPDDWREAVRLGGYPTLGAFVTAYDRKREEVMPLPVEQVASVDAERELLRNSNLRNDRLPPEGSRGAAASPGP